MSSSESVVEDSRRHLREAGETYGQHMAFALRYARSCGAAALMAAVHAFVPGFFPRGASTIVRGLAGDRKIG
jgi:hypothetical protein